MTEAKCPVCGTIVQKPYRDWCCTPKAKAGEIKVMINCFECPSCGKKFRTATREWPKKKGFLKR